MSQQKEHICQKREQALLLYSMILQQLSQNKSMPTEREWLGRGKEKQGIRQWHSDDLVGR